MCMTGRRVALMSVALASVVLTACAQTPKQLSYFVEDPARFGEVLWPELPQVPRYRYAGQLLGDQAPHLGADRQGAVLQVVALAERAVELSRDGRHLVWRDEAGLDRVLRALQLRQALGCRLVLRQGRRQRAEDQGRGQRERQQEQ